MALKKKKDLKNQVMKVIKKEIKDNFSFFYTFSNICFLTKGKVENKEKAKDKFTGFLNH